MKRLHCAVLLGASSLLSACGGGSEIGGTVLGLTAPGLTLSDGYETISVAEDATSFSFPTVVDEGKGYAVVVVTQPSGLRCSIANGTGTATATGTVSGVSVGCVPVWIVSGTLTGVAASGLVLNNGYEDIGIAAFASSFAFPTALAPGSSYLVVVKTAPLGQVCSVVNGEGTVGDAPVSDVAVRCN
jgi:hypothetical protein